MQVQHVEKRIHPSMHATCHRRHQVTKRPRRCCMSTWPPEKHVVGALPRQSCHEIHVNGTWKLPDGVELKDFLLNFKQMERQSSVKICWIVERLWSCRANSGNRCSPFCMLQRPAASLGCVHDSWQKVGLKSVFQQWRQVQVRLHTWMLETVETELILHFLGSDRQEMLKVFRLNILEKVIGDVQLQCAGLDVNERTGHQHFSPLWLGQVSSGKLCGRCRTLGTRTKISSNWEDLLQINILEAELFAKTV